MKLGESCAEACLAHSLLRNEWGTPTLHPGDVGYP